MVEALEGMPVPRGSGDQPALQLLGIRVAQVIRHGRSIGRWHRLDTAITADERDIAPRLAFVN
jgi:hypothetical protein